MMPLTHILYVVCDPVVQMLYWALGGPSGSMSAAFDLLIHYIYGQEITSFSHF